MNGGRWRWESTPKIHSDFDFAMNEVLYFVLLFSNVFVKHMGLLFCFIVWNIKQQFCKVWHKKKILHNKTVAPLVMMEWSWISLLPGTLLLLLGLKGLVIMSREF